ncbi:MAG: circularly permuted type 2 ATP-grasp protein, partial [Burkholderiaceae bacterium]|nr:circularly permuted type 2 ATP-grasp protein [Burkholderiaceae bacterium]
MSAAPIGGSAAAASTLSADEPGLFGAAPHTAVDIAAHLARAGVPGHFDELRGSSAAAAAADLPAAMPAPWREFFERLGSAGFEDLNHRLTALQRRIRDNGITYNVHADARGAERPWALDLFPLIVPPADWAQIERGVLQRAQLLEAMMRDLYDGQSLLECGLLPPALVHGHPGYLRAMRGLQPPGGQYLHIAAFDLTRDAQGRWLVVGQKLQSPSGLGYLLENRITVSSFFPEAFREMRVQRLAASYRALVDKLMRASGAGSAARVVLLTPGPANETYFEHVYLARYLGLTLVEGQDLVVRDERVYLRTIQGLEPVHAILRRLDDVWLDPLELRADSALGVPGLLQA